MMKTKSNRFLMSVHISEIYSVQVNSCTEFECNFGFLNTSAISTEYNFGLLNTKAKHWIKLWLTDYKNPRIEHKIVVTYWIIRKKIVGNRN